MRTGRGAALLVLALGAAACSGEAGAIDSTEVVCDEFAAHARDGLPAGERGTVVSSIGEVIGNAEQGIRDAFPGLQRAAGGTDSAYQLAADTFAQRCIDAGWDG